MWTMVGTAMPDERAIDRLDAVSRRLSGGPEVGLVELLDEVDARRREIARLLLTASA